MNYHHTQINSNNNNNLSDKNLFYYENHLDSGQIFFEYNKPNYFLNKNTYSCKNQTQSNLKKSQEPNNASRSKINLYKKQTYDYFYPQKKYCRNSTVKKVIEKNSNNNNNSLIKEFDDEISEIKKTDSVFEETLELNNKKLTMLLEGKNCLKYNNYINEQKKLKEKIISLNKEIIEKNKIINEFSSLVKESKEKFEQLILQNKSKIAEIELKHKNEINILENKLQNLENENQILKFNNNKLMLLIKKSKKNNNILNSDQGIKNIRNIRINEANSNLRDKKNLSSTRCTPKTTLLNNQNNSSCILGTKKYYITKTMGSCRNYFPENNSIENYINNNIKPIKNIKNISYSNINSYSKKNTSMKNFVNSRKKEICIRLNKGNIIANDFFIN